MKKQVQPLTRRPCTPGSPATGRTWTCPSPPSFGRLRDYGKNNGYTVAREYADEAESGRIADRPQFRKMIDEDGRANAPSR